jgi:hypothetical protein
MTPLCLKINFLGAHSQANLFSVLECPWRWYSQQLSFHISANGRIPGIFCHLAGLKSGHLTDGRRSGAQTDSILHSSGSGCLLSLTEILGPLSLFLPTTSSSAFRSFSPRTVFCRDPATPTVSLFCSSSYKTRAIVI